MKRLLFISILILAVGSFAQAQRGTGQRPSQTGGAPHEGQRMDPAQRIEQQLTRLNEMLTFTEDQKAKVKVVFQKYSDKQREMFTKMRESGGEPDRDKMRGTMGEIRKQQDNEIKALLTKEQGVKYDAFLKQREEERAKRAVDQGQR